jgi:hypothetical protein
VLPRTPRPRATARCRTLRVLRALPQTPSALGYRPVPNAARNQGGAYLPPPWEPPRKRPAQRQSPSLYGPSDAVVVSDAPTHTHAKNITHTQHSELIDTGMEFIDATLYREKRDEEELSAAMKELEHICHLVKYYQDTTQAAVFLRSEFQEAYSKFMDERHLFTIRIVELQEENLMALVM